MKYTTRGKVRRCDAYTLTVYNVSVKLPRRHQRGVARCAAKCTEKRVSGEPRARSVGVSCLRSFFRFFFFFPFSSEAPRDVTGPRIPQHGRNSLGRRRKSIACMAAARLRTRTAIAPRPYR